MVYFICIVSQEHHNKKIQIKLLTHIQTFLKFWWEVFGNSMYNRHFFLMYHNIFNNNIFNILNMLQRLIVKVLYPILGKCQCFQKCRHHNCIAFRTMFCFSWANLYFVEKRDDVIKSVINSTVIVQYWHQMFSIFLCKCIFRLSLSQMFTNSMFIGIPVVLICGCWKGRKISIKNKCVTRLACVSSSNTAAESWPHLCSDCVNVSRSDTCVNQKKNKNKILPRPREIRWHSKLLRSGSPTWVPRSLV